MSGWVYFLAGLAVILLLVLLRGLARATRVPRRHASLTPRTVPDEVSRQAASRLSTLVKRQTVSREGNPNSSEWVRLREDLRTLFPLVHKTMTRETVGGFSLIYHWSAPVSVGNPLLFCAHMDVAPADEKWTHPPFDGLISGGQVWGRGTLDCKNLLTCLLGAAEALLARGYTPNRDIYFAIGHDEETGGEEGASACATWFARRNIHFEMVLDEGFSLDPDFLGIPAAPVGVSEKGLCHVHIWARESGLRPDQPFQETAAGRLSEAICRLEMAPRRLHALPVVLDTFAGLAPWLSFRTRFLTANAKLFRRRLLKYCARQPELMPMVRSTMTVTVVRAGVAHNVNPSKADAIVNVRLLHGETPDNILTYLRDLTGDLGIDMETDVPVNPSRISRYRGKPFTQLSDSIQTTFGELPVVPALLPRNADARHYEALSSHVYRFSPFVLTRDERLRIHNADERVRVEALGTATLFYTDLMRRLSGGLDAR